MFRLDTENRLRADNLANLGWLDHAFGTRLSPPPPDDIPVVSLKQIHSDQVLSAERPGVAGEGDALISDRPGLALAIRTADCLPVLLADIKRRKIAVAHAGWRGVVQQIVPKTAGWLTKRFGTHAEDLRIAIGPGIGPCCFEVGPEVAVQFADLFPERQDLGGKCKIDLAEAVRRQLRQLFITADHIETSGLCTCCDPDLFHSYRRDRDSAGRMMATIGIR